MKFYFLILFLVSSFVSHSQQWIDYKVDDNLSVRVPEEFEVQDTLGVYMIMAYPGDAIVAIQRLPNTGQSATSIQDKEQLLENYTGFQKGMIDSQKGELITQQLVEKDGLQLIEFSFAATFNEQNEVRHCLAGLVDDHWYTVQFYEPEEMSEEFAATRDSLFGSVKFRDGLSLKNQLSNPVEGSEAYKFAQAFGKILAYVLLGVIFIAAIVLFMRWRNESVNGNNSSTSV